MEFNIQSLSINAKSEIMSTLLAFLSLDYQSEFTFNDMIKLIVDDLPDNIYSHRREYTEGYSHNWNKKSYFDRTFFLLA